jgi:hypothetical protein
MELVGAFRRPQILPLEPPPPSGSFSWRYFITSGRMSEVRVRYFPLFRYLGTVTPVQAPSGGPLCPFRST